MKKRISSVLLCLCMIATLLPMTVFATESYQDYQITEHNFAHVEAALAGVADVTQDGDNIIIELASDLNGCLHIGEDSYTDWDGAFVLDLNGYTIDPGSSLNEAICLDNNFEGSLTITGDGTIKTGINNIIYTWDANIFFAVENGFDYFTLKIGDNSEKYTVTQQHTYRIRGSELVIEQGRESTEAVYPFAYDVQRDPDFPEFKGDEITVRSFYKPLDRNEDHYSSFEGVWTLAEVGTYDEKDSFDPTPKSYLGGIVDIIADNYELDDDGKNGLVIHKLTDENDNLVGYGVVIAVDETNGYTLFIADLWGDSGAGYLLSSTEIPRDSGAITLNTEQMAQSTYSVELDQRIISFADAQTEYSAPDAKTVKITNTGDAASGALTVSLSGGDDSDFTLCKNSIDDIAVGGSDTFTIVPKTGLPAGTYTEIITVKGDKIMPVTATVSFTVNATPATYTVTFDANGGTVDSATATTETDGKLASLPTPTRSGSYRFNGWFTAASGGRKVTADTVFDEDTTIYAQWTYTGSTGGRSISYYTVTFNTDGGSKVTSQRIRRNAKATEPEVPAKDGFEFKGWYTDKEFENAYDFTAKVTKSITLYAKWVEEKVVHVCPSEKFSDLDTTKWYHEDIDYVLENNIMLGTADTIFDPEENLTRGMLVTILYRSEGEPATNRSIPFADVDMGAYYASAVIWAQQNGIVKGISETEYAPDMSVTREQLATIMFRYAQLKGMDAVTTEENLHFDDASSVAEWAVTSMNWGVGKNYVFSRTEGKINPKEAATRAEVAAFIHRYLADSDK